MKKTSRLMSTLSTPSNWGAWSPVREWARGLLHFGIGLLAWAALHPFYLDNRTVTISLIVVVSFFLLLEAARLAVVKSHSKVWFIRFLKWINHKYVEKLLVREAEKFRATAIFQTALGCVLMWVIGPRWIGALAGLLLGVCDPIAKLGRRWPIYRFSNGKSLGGMLFGMIGGVAASCLIVLVHQFIPLFPTSLSVGHIALVYAIGVLSAPIFEFIGGKWDNLLIIAGSTIAMTLVSWALLV